MAEITDPALYLWVVMSAELRRRSEQKADVLTPDCAITPTHLQHALKRHSKEFLGTARFNVHFFKPSQHDSEHGAFTVTPDPNAVFKEAFTCIFAGEIVRTQQRKPDAPFGEIVLGCPDWTRSGWPMSSFAEMWEAQRLTLREVLGIDFYNQNPDAASLCRSWFEGQCLLVNFGDDFPHPVCLVPADDGSYESTEPIATATEFPFKVGDTVVVQGHLHRRLVRRAEGFPSIQVVNSLLCDMHIDFNSQGYFIQGAKIKLVRAKMNAPEVEESSESEDEDDLMTSTPVSSEKSRAMSAMSNYTVNLNNASPMGSRRSIPSFTKYVVRDVHARMDEEQQLIGPNRMFLGLLFATGDSTPLMVRVPLRLDVKTGKSPRDLDQTWWIPHSTETHASTTDVFSSMAIIRHWPMDDPDPLDYYYTVFCLDQTPNFEVIMRGLQPPNRIIAEMLPNHPSVWYGNVLVVRSLRNVSKDGGEDGIGDMSRADTLTARAIVKWPSTKLPTPRMMASPRPSTAAFTTPDIVSSLLRWAIWPEFLALSQVNRLAAVQSREVFWERLLYRFARFVSTNPNATSDEKRTLVARLFQLLEETEAVIIGALPLAMVTFSYNEDPDATITMFEIIVPPTAESRWRTYFEGDLEYDRRLQHGRRSDYDSRLRYTHAYFRPDSWRERPAINLPKYMTDPSLAATRVRSLLHENPSSTRANFWVRALRVSSFTQRILYPCLMLPSAPSDASRPMIVDENHTCQNPQLNPEGPCSFVPRREEHCIAADVDGVRARRSPETTASELSDLHHLSRFERYLSQPALDLASDAASTEWARFRAQTRRPVALDARAVDPVKAMRQCPKEAYPAFAPRTHDIKLRGEQNEVRIPDYRFLGCNVRPLRFHDLSPRPNIVYTSMNSQPLDLVDGVFPDAESADSYDSVYANVDVVSRLALSNHLDRVQQENETPRVLQWLQTSPNFASPDSPWDFLAADQAVVDDEDPMEFDSDDSSPRIVLPKRIGHGIFHAAEPRLQRLPMEILLTILGWVSLESLVYLSVSGSTSIRYAAFTIVRQRFNNLLHTFFGPHAQEIANVMRKFNGGLVGAAAMWVASPFTKDGDPLYVHEMNIAVGIGGFNALEPLLTRAGFAVRRKIPGRVGQVFSETAADFVPAYAVPSAFEGTHVHCSLAEQSMADSADDSHAGAPAAAAGVAGPAAPVGIPGPAGAVAGMPALEPVDPDDQPLTPMEAAQIYLAPTTKPSVFVHESNHIQPLREIMLWAVHSAQLLFVTPSTIIDFGWYLHRRGVTYIRRSAHRVVPTFNQSTMVARFALIGKHALFFEEAPVFSKDNRLRFYSSMCAPNLCHALLRCVRGPDPRRLVWIYDRGFVKDETDNDVPDFIQTQASEQFSSGLFALTFSLDVCNNVNCVNDLAYQSFSSLDRRILESNSLQTRGEIVLRGRARNLNTLLAQVNVGSLLNGCRLTSTSQMYDNKYVVALFYGVSCPRPSFVRVPVIQVQDGRIFSHDQLRVEYWMGRQLMHPQFNNVTMLAPPNSYSGAVSYAHFFYWRIRFPLVGHRGELGLFFNCLSPDGTRNTHLMNARTLLQGSRNLDIITGDVLVVCFCDGEIVDPRLVTTQSAIAKHILE
uniref:F-box domain-containing protein n=1 Tax=Mycena chlorophos TaxID=658473 RepID=A0ABQ0LP18_MYCCL|nr:predicted protein [Mycena chlorophos]